MFVLKKFTQKDTLTTPFYTKILAATFYRNHPQQIIKQVVNPISRQTFVYLY